MRGRGHQHAIGLLMVVLTLAIAPAVAGTACQPHQVDGSELRLASAAAMRVVAELEARDRPFAIVSRIGQDLSEFGLRYSHAGLVVRDHVQGRWTVLHQLNHCGSDRSGLYAEGLLNFFVDDLLLYDAHLLWPDDSLNAGLARVLSEDAGRRIYQPEYNVIARYGSHQTQNSTAWLIELLGLAMAIEQPRCKPTRGGPRSLAWCALDAEGFQPAQIRISYGRRIMGGLFSANTRFTDHPVGARLSGKYEVVTVDSILRFAAHRSVARMEVSAIE